jgi:hypothetical protein
VFRYLPRIALLVFYLPTLTTTSERASSKVGRYSLDWSFTDGIHCLNKDQALTASDLCSRTEGALNSMWLSSQTQGRIRNWIRQHISMVGQSTEYMGPDVGRPSMCV